MIVFDGDGSLCMQLGSLPTIAGVAPRNLTHLLFKNNVYHTSGSQVTPGAEVLDWVMMAKGAGYREAFAVTTLAELERRLPTILNGDGPIFVELHTTLAEKTPMTDRGGRRFTNRWRRCEPASREAAPDRRRIGPARGPDRWRSSRCASSVSIPRSAGPDSGCRRASSPRRSRTGPSPTGTRRSSWRPARGTGSRIR